MQVRAFFTTKQMAELHRIHEGDKAYLESGTRKPIGGGYDFGIYQDVAMCSYLVGDHARAGKYLRIAVELGFPPKSTSNSGGDYGQQWENYQNGARALPMGLAAHLVGMTKQRDEILTWSASRLIDTELLTAEENGRAAKVTLWRAYALLAARRFWPRLEPELHLAARLIHEAIDFPHERALPKTLIALVQGQKGNISRRAVTAVLQQYIRESKPDVWERVQACFHALYLQSAFPDVFDPILPPFPVPAAPAPTGETERQAE